MIAAKGPVHRRAFSRRISTAPDGEQAQQPMMCADAVAECTNAARPIRIEWIQNLRPS